MTCRPGSAPRGPFLVVLIACLMTLAVGACGRRGQPEEPVNPAAPAAASKRTATAPGTRGPETRSASGGGVLATSPGSATQLTPDDETDEDDPNQGVSPQPTPTPARRRGRAYQVPKEPFILDPLL